MVWASQSANAKRRPQNTLIWATVVTKRSYLIAMQIGGSACVISGPSITQRDVNRSATACQPVEPTSRTEQAGKPDVDVTVMGARWGAIIGRH